MASRRGTSRFKGMGARFASGVAYGRNAEPGAPGYQPPIKRVAGPSPTLGRTRGVADVTYLKKKPKRGPKPPARGGPSRLPGKTREPSYKFGTWWHTS